MLHRLYNTYSSVHIAHYNTHTDNTRHDTTSEQKNYMVGHVCYTHTPHYLRLQCGRMSHPSVCPAHTAKHFPSKLPNLFRQNPPNI